MIKKINIDYPALVYKKNIFYVANCVLFNLFAVGRTEIEAIENLEKTMNQALPEYNISIKPIYENQYLQSI